MRVITLARKPLVGSVADNVLRHGTGGLNIEASRIGTQGEKLQGGAGGLLSDIRDNTPYPEGHEFVQAEGGRWPANIILEHRPECRQVGTKKVKNPGGVPKTLERVPRVAYGQETRMPEGYVHPHYFDQDGLEEVPAWECAPDCPVKALDEQSGLSFSSGGGLNRDGNNAETIYGAQSGHAKINNVGLGDTGGASRFFKHVGGRKEEDADQE